MFTEEKIIGRNEAFCGYQALSQCNEAQGLPAADFWGFSGWWLPKSAGSRGKRCAAGGKGGRFQRQEPAVMRLRRFSGDFSVAGQFDFALKGRGFSRAVSLAKSIAALRRRGTC